MPSWRRKAMLLAEGIPSLSVANIRSILLSAILFHASMLAQVSITIGSSTEVHTNNINILLTGIWTNNGSFSSGASTVILNGAEAQTISGTVPTAFNCLTVNNAAGVALNAPATVNGVLTLTTGLLTAASPHAITFGALAMNPIESSSSRIVGTALMSPRAVGTGSLTFLGINIAAGSDDVGDVSVTRVTGPDGVITVGSNSGIACNWDITVGSQPGNGRAVTFSWLSNLDNEKVVTAVTVYREDAGGWVQVGDVTDASSSDPRIVTVNGVTQFSRWTVSGSSVPLPIQLASFSASVIRDKDVEVTWKTVSETNNYGFEIQRKRGTTGAWKKLGFVPAHGTTLDEQSYAYLDRSVTFGKYFYRIAQIDLDGKSKTFPEIEVIAGVNPSQFLLAQNYPNPFNPSSTIEYALPKPSYVTLRIYDMLGRLVQTLVDETQEAGLYQVQLNASGFASGVYFYRLTAGSFVDVKKLVLVR
jgi:hypothetical protein